MSTKSSTLDFLLDQTARAGLVTARKMFGEYALYLNGKLVGLVCDDRLFVKSIPEIRAYIGEKSIEEGFPYPRAKPHIVISEDRWEDDEWMAELLRLLFKHLPEPKTRPAR